jgi:heme/copper-type cytochrome/quinol oxidase subunit 3
MSGSVTRSMEATTNRATAVVESRRRSMPSGWIGMILLIATEATLLGCLIATYFYLRFKVVDWPPPGIEKPSLTLPLVFTGMLIASCAPFFAGVQAAKAGLARAAWLLIASATAIQATYLGLQIHLFIDDLNKFAPDETAYGSVYFAMVGAHHAHVAVGLAFDAWLLAKLLGGLTNYRLLGVRVVALYWYFVAATAIPVVLTQLYPSL